jgi:hypothetical protein
MPRAPKYDDIPFEKFVSSGKIMMYSSPNWKTAYPIVDIIRLLKKNTIIQCKVGKGQSEIDMYGTQYYHRIVRCDLNTKQDYDNLCRAFIKTIFIYTDVADTVAKNLLKCADTLKICAVCYSGIDEKYHYYDYTNAITDPFTKETTNVIKNIFTKAEEVIEHMYHLVDFGALKKYNELFPEELLFDEPECKTINLNECIVAMKIADEHERQKAQLLKTKQLSIGSVGKILFDPHSAKLKKMEYQREQKKITYSDDIEKINKSFSTFFTKPPSKQ